MTVLIIHATLTDESDDPEKDVSANEWNEAHAITQAEGSILGRIDSGVGPTTELSPAQVRTLINVEDGANNYALPDTAVTPGDYTNANISVDQQGRITAAANGTPGGTGVVETIVAGTGITVDATDSANPIVSATGGGGSFFHDTFENVTTDNTTPKDVDPTKFRTVVTSDGSGLPQTLNFPALTIADQGRPHLVVYQNQVNGESLVISGVAETVGNYFLDGGNYLVVRWSGTQWSAWDSNDIEGTQVLTRVAGVVDFTEATSLPGDPNDIGSTNTLDLAIGDSVDLGEYLTFLTSGGTGGIELFFMGPGLVSGHRKVIQTFSMTAPGDVPSLDPDNIETEAGDPIGAILFGENQEILLEWRRVRNGGSGMWIVIEGFDGMLSAFAGRMDAESPEDTFAATGTVT